MQYTIKRRKKKHSYNLIDKWLCNPLQCIDQFQFTSCMLNDHALHSKTIWQILCSFVRCSSALFVCVFGMVCWFVPDGQHAHYMCFDTINIAFSVRSHMIEVRFNWGWCTPSSTSYSHSHGNNNINNIIIIRKIMIKSFWSCHFVCCQIQPYIHPLFFRKIAYCTIAINICCCCAGILATIAIGIDDNNIKLLHTHKPSLSREKNDLPVCSCSSSFCGPFGCHFKRGGFVSSLFLSLNITHLMWLSSFRKLPTLLFSAIICISAIKRCGSTWL